MTYPTTKSDLPDNDREKRNEVRPAVEAFFKQRTAVIIGDMGHAIDPVGTGTFAYIAGVPVVLTAHHVYMKAQRLGQTRVGSFHLSGPTGIDLKKSWFTPIGSFKTPIFKGLDLDLCALRLSDEVYRNNPDLFVDETMLGDDELIFNTEHFVAGFPEQFTERKAQTGKEYSKVTLMMYATNLTPSDNWPTEYSPATHLVLDYPTEMMESRHGLIQAPDPCGVSGGGIWRVINSGQKIWSPTSKLRLVGIEHEWLRGQRRLIGSKLGRLINEIKGDIT